MLLLQSRAQRCTMRSGPGWSNPVRSLRRLPAAHSRVEILSLASAAKAGSLNISFIWLLIYPDKGHRNVMLDFKIKMS